MHSRKAVLYGEKFISFVGIPTTVCSRFLAGVVMASYEIKSDGLCVIETSGSSRNKMFYNRIRRILNYVETPKEFGDFSPEKLIRIVNEVLTHLAYVEYGRCYTKTGWEYYYSGYIYFVCKEDAMAFKLRWS